jgi:hypothetical protein
MARNEPSFEQMLVEVWRQALVENAAVVELDGKRYSVRITPRKGLRQVDFIFDSNEIRGLEQNPDTKSRWAMLARSGKKVMQFERGSLRRECRGWESDFLWARNRWMMQEFHEHKSGNEGKVPEVYCGCKAGRHSAVFKGGLQWWIRSTFRAKR